LSLLVKKTNYGASDFTVEKLDVPLFELLAVIVLLFLELNDYKMLCDF
jgi:hypothetical protein